MRLYSLPIRAGAEREQLLCAQCSAGDSRWHDPAREDRIFRSEPLSKHSHKKQIPRSTEPSKKPSGFPWLGECLPLCVQTASPPACQQPLEMILQMGDWGLSQGQRGTHPRSCFHLEPASSLPESRFSQGKFGALGEATPAGTAEPGI